ncbi:type II toxin-antitoxin system RelE/ParE family toxin [Pseudomonas guariconensis]|uniref:type II toxin-antitoxin system RelE/ParE family toxin n=1 Tax=Pseudomonas guariconensis TaxID=1288410 RepID=UPI0018ABD54A|nr:type II toxin-antitoxin system RelE/ParE family toxin [Pseudomonas guariconensis]MBF8743560.1 type II toxin-antitoxin system RelE/ParE family toxin [Pseudomonas guariconensis]MBF8752293.1 type II toxin-antitoxin system RelE/ParE family toxin [Pseudomonas guariconensis]
MLFIETPVFTKRVKSLLDDEAYRALQLKLMGTPEAGDLIEGTGGLRKIRVAAKGHGTRGGARVIYYHFVSTSQLAMLYIYPKNEEQELSSAKRSALRTIIENWKRS